MLGKGNTLTLRTFSYSPSLSFPPSPPLCAHPPSSHPSGTSSASHPASIMPLYPSYHPTRLLPTPQPAEEGRASSEPEPSILGLLLHYQRAPALYAKPGIRARWFLLILLERRRGLLYRPSLCRLLPHRGEERRLAWLEVTSTGTKQRRTRRMRV